MDKMNQLSDAARKRIEDKVKKAKEKIDKADEKPKRRRLPKDQIGYIKDHKMHAW